MRLAGAAATAGSLLLASAALAWIPKAEIVSQAAANANAAGGRARALTLTVVVRREGEPEPIARGTLTSDPSGVAKLELRHASGFNEKQVRRGKDLEVTRDGEPVESPRPLLPPFWLLQAKTGGELQSRLLELGGEPALVALGHEGDHDCTVLGGRQGGPALWIDQDSQAPVRIDLGPATHYRFGPLQSQGGISVPLWIAVEAQELPPLRIEIDGAKPAAPASR